MYLLLARGGNDPIVPFLSLCFFFPLIYLDPSDHKESSDMTQSISKQVREDVHGVKRIHNIKSSIPLVNNFGQGSIKLIKLYRP